MKLIDLTGKKFGRLTVIKRNYPNSECNAARWLCECTCGVEKIILGGSLKAGSTKSCGCLKKEQVREMNKNNRIDMGLASMRAAISRYKMRAEKRGLEYVLTEDQFAEVAKQNCFYCGAEPSNIQNNEGCNGTYTYNGLDRVDNSKGYTMDNVVPCCKICNYAKGSLTLQEFKDWIGRVYMIINNGERRN